MSKKSVLSTVLGNIKKVQEDLSSKNSNSSPKDETVWQAPWDEQKKIGNALIAFLPFADIFKDEENGETSPYIAAHVHSNMVGKNGKKYYGILCPSSRSGNSHNECAICEEFFRLWNKDEESRAIGKKLSLSRKRQYAGNIIVLKNEKNPDEVGKIFKWRFGITVQQKINDRINPSDGEDPIIVHNVYNILPFKVKVTEKGGYRDFSGCEWGMPGKSIADYLMPNVKKASSEDIDEWIDENILSKLFSVSDFVTDEMFKTKEELEKIVLDVLDAAEISTDREPEKAADNSSKIREAIDRAKSAPSTSSASADLKEIMGDEADDESDQVDTEESTKSKPVSKASDFDVESIFKT